MSKLLIPQIIPPDKPTKGMQAVLGSCRIIYLPKIPDYRGNLTFIEGSRHVPFAIKRVYYLYDVPGGVERGAHAHKKLEEIIIAMSGSFDVVLDDGFKRVRVHLNRSYYGLYLSKMIWRNLDNFSTGSVCLAVASTPYCKSDYIRNYTDFKSRFARVKLVNPRMAKSPSKG